MVDVLELGNTDAYTLIVRHCATSFNTDGITADIFALARYRKYETIRAIKNIDCFTLVKPLLHTR